MYDSENENSCHSKFVWYAERSSLGDINPKSHHLIAFEYFTFIFQALNVQFCGKI